MSALRPSKAARLCIIDDEPAIVEMMEKFFTRRGYHVSSCTSSGEAFDVVKRHDPAVVLLDVFMPGKNGLMVLGEIKRRFPDMRVIMVTALDHEDMAAKALRLGASDYVVKPFDLEYLEKVVLQKVRSHDR